MSSTRKIITVFGATGATGGSVAKYLLDDGTFAVRAITRDAGSDKAKALSALGAEIVQADLNKPETLAAAVAGAYGVSALTDWWTLLPTLGFDPQKAQDAEEQQGKNIVDAAKGAGVQHVFFFSLLGGDCPHAEGKHRASEYLKASGVPYTLFYNGFYFENFISRPGTIKLEDDGTYKLGFSCPQDLVFPSYSVDQSGGWALAAFKDPTEYSGKSIFGIGENVTLRQYAAYFSEITGKTVRAEDMTTEAFEAQAQSDNVFVKELYLMFKLFQEELQPPNSPYDVAASAAVYPDQHDFKQFAKHNQRFKQFIASF